MRGCGRTPGIFGKCLAAEEFRASHPRTFGKSGRKAGPRKGGEEVATDGLTTASPGV